MTARRASSRLGPLALALALGATPGAHALAQEAGEEPPDAVAESSDEPAAEGGEGGASDAPVEGEPAEPPGERGPATDESAGEPAGDEDAPGDPGAEEDAETGSDGSSADADESPTESGSPARRARAEDAAVFEAPDSGSPAAAVLGVSTVTLGVATAATLGYFLERTGQIDTCEAAESVEDSERGCVNLGTIEGQREVGLGVFIGTAAVFGVVAIAWAIVAATDDPDASGEAAAECAPTLGGLVCRGRF